MRLGIALGVVGLLPMIARPVLAAPVTTATTQIQDIRYNPLKGTFDLPFKGPRPPLVALGSNHNDLVLDIPRVGFRYREFFVEVDRSPLVRAYVAAIDPESRGLHVVIEGAVPLHLVTDSTGLGSLLRFRLVPMDPHQVSNQADSRDVVQRVMATPLDGTGQKTYTLSPPPPPVVVIPPNWTHHFGPWTFPIPRLSLFYGLMSEQYEPQQVEASDPSTARAGLVWEPRSGDNLLTLQIERGTSAFSDPDYQGVTHLQSETLLETTWARLYGLYGMAMTTGIGYQLSWLQTTNSAAPQTPTFLFAANQILHGPVLSQTVAGSFWLTPWGDLKGELAVDWAPWLFASIDQGTDQRN